MPRIAPATPYPLERLYADQAREWVVDTIPAVIAWLGGASWGPKRQPHVFDVECGSGHSPPTRTRLSIVWDMNALAAHDPSLLDRAQRYASGQTVHREHVAECAGYGLALVAISQFLPGRRVVAMRKGLAPDLLLDATRGSLRGVEVAARATGGLSTLRFVRLGSAKKPGKAPEIVAMPDVVEAHISLWCQAPHVAELWKVKP